MARRGGGQVTSTDPADAPDPPSSQDAPSTQVERRQVGPLRVAAGPMVAVTVLLLVVAPRYGPHWDELYFGMLPLQWWYVDQPPLTVWLSWLATQVRDELWVQRLPAILAAATGAFVAGLYPRVLGAGLRSQRLAAWAHASTVYPLIMGHIFTTAAIDLLAWQVVILLVLRAGAGHPRSLVWAGVVAGLATWNKLLVVVLLLALFVGLLLTDRRLLRTRHTVLGVVLFGLLAAPQGLAQLLNGMPMSQVSAGLVEAQGDLVRLTLLPALLLFVGPPLLLVWVTGLVDPWRTPGTPGPFLLPAVLVLVAWTLVNPSQPHYPAGALLPALAMGWASPRLRARWSPAKRRGLVTANAVVASLVCLPLLPATDPWLSLQSRVNPTIRDQVGWPDYVDQVRQVQRDGEEIITDTYALAGALHRYGTAEEATRVHSGHNALWDLGPPSGDRVLLVGEHAVAQRESFGTCTPAGTLQTRPVAHPQLIDAPMLRCEEPVSDWATLWPQFRRLSGW